MNSLSKTKLFAEYFAKVGIEQLIVPLNLSKLKCNSAILRRALTKRI